MSLLFCCKVSELTYPHLCCLFTHWLYDPYKNLDLLYDRRLSSSLLFTLYLFTFSPHNSLSASLIHLDLTRSTKIFDRLTWLVGLFLLLPLGE
jgi:hypothetical protein